MYRLWGPAHDVGRIKLGMPAKNRVYLGAFCRGSDHQRVRMVSRMCGVWEQHGSFGKVRLPTARASYAVAFVMSMAQQAKCWGAYRCASIGQMPQWERFDKKGSCRNRSESRGSVWSVRRIYRSALPTHNRVKSEVDFPDVRPRSQRSGDGQPSFPGS